MAGKFDAKFAHATLSGQNQTIDGVQKIVASILNLAGCGRCGRLAALRVDFLSDPPPDLVKEGVTSFVEQGLRAG